MNPVSIDRDTVTTMREVTKTVRLQRRHLLFWLGIVVFAAFLSSVILNGSSLFASTYAPDIVETSTAGTALAVAIQVKPDGSAIVNNKPTKKIFKPTRQFDELRYKLLDKPKVFIDQMVVRVSFAKPLPAATKIESLAVHGIDSATQNQIDDHTIEYTANGIGPEATYTIVAELPPGTTNWPWYRRLASLISSLPVGFWLVLASLMPISTIAVLLLMFWPHLRDLLMPSSRLELMAPPAPISAAVAGIILNGRVSAREIAATLISLANRGYLTIYNRGGGQFSFAKRRAWQGLESFELLLMTQLFNAKNYKSTDEDIELSIGKTLFSPVVAKVYVAMYDAATAAGYFKKNPVGIHQTYRMIGLFLFFLGLGAFVTALLVELQPNNLLFLFAGMMTMALIIMVAADDAPLLTAEGEKARREWLAFKNYLTSSELISYTEGAQAYYERFLPYAIVLKAEIPWVNRFRKHPFNPPSWYDSADQSMPIETFAHGLYTIVGSIAELFSSVKEPTIE